MRLFRSLSIFATTLPLMAAAQPAGGRTADTIWIEIGSPKLDGRVYKPHAARVRVRVGDSDRVTAEWTNELTVGDSAGRQVHRWVTKGTQFPLTGTGPSYELRQTYDAITLKPLGYHLVSTTGAFWSVSIDGNNVRGTKRVPGDTTTQQVDVTIDRPGFYSGASDLVPLAVGMKAGSVIVAPVWHPSWTKSQLRIFTVVGTTTVDVEGTTMEAWKVDEYNYADRKLQASWYLLDKSPYMVYGEVPLPNGSIQRMSEVEIQRP